MSKYEDLIGVHFGRLTVEEPMHVIEGRSGTRILWVCRCRCGNVVRASARDLRDGKVVSCGCKKKDAPWIRHGETRGRKRTPEWNAFAGMHARCYQETATYFEHYGGRSIRVTRRWNTFANFLADMGRRPSSRHTLERIDVNKGYGPKNCCWATRSAQNWNKRNTVRLAYRGWYLPLVDWARETGVPAVNIRERINKGWTVERALTQRVGGRR